MAYTQAVSSSITRNTTSASEATFNYPLFAAAHAYFNERVRSYSSWTSFKSDTDIVSGSNTYNAVKIAFSQTPCPEVVYIARQAVDSVTLTPSSATTGTTYSFNIVTYDTSDNSTVDDATISFTATSDTLSDITAGLVDAVTSLAPTGFTATDNSTDVTVEAVSGYNIVLTSFTNIDDTYTSTETAADLLTAINEENTDWYWMCWEDHTADSIVAMASEIEATGSDNQPHMYFTSTADTAVLTAYTEGTSTDIGSQLLEAGYDRTCIQWHDEADTLFPEMALVGKNATYQPGGITWKFTQLSGVSAALNPVTGIELSDTLKGYLEDRYVGFMGTERGVVFYHEGHTTSGEWIDVIRGSDWLNDQIDIEILDLLLNQEGGKVAMTPAGFKQVTNTIDTVLAEAVDVGFLYGYVPATAPTYSEVSYTDKVDRLLEDVDWTGYIAGAIHTVVVSGNLTYADSDLD